MATVLAVGEPHHMSVSGDILSAVLAIVDAWVARLVCRAFRDHCAAALPNLIASAVGSPETLELALALGVDPKRAAPVAARGGHIATLEWAADRSVCSVDETTCAAAAQGGQLACLEWLWARGCAFDSRTTCAAARTGRVDILEAVRRARHPFDADDACEYWDGIFSAAAASGDVRVLAWVWDGCDFVNDTDYEADLCGTAASHGHLEALEWLCSKGCDWGATANAAAMSGHAAVLEWAIPLGCPVDRETCRHAADCGHLDVLQTLRRHSCAWGVETCEYAARSGQLEVLKWARAAGCEWDDWAMTGAARNGHTQVLEWMRTNGDKLISDIYLAAIHGGHVAVLEWADAHGCEWPTDPMDLADTYKTALNRNRDVREWVERHLASGSLLTVTQAASATRTSTRLPP